jgi:hypothetical protein
VTETPRRELHGCTPAISERTDVRAGFPLPLGDLEWGGGTDFAALSRGGSRIRLEFFDHPGIRGIPHTDYEPTRAKPASYGLRTGEGAIHATN